MMPKFSLITIGLVAVAGSALAASPLARSSEGYAVRARWLAVARGDDPPAAAACENGEARDESGACPNIDDSTSTRGFTLFSGSAVKPKAPAPAAAPTPTATAAREMRPAAA